MQRTKNKDSTINMTDQELNLKILQKNQKKEINEVGSHLEVIIEEVEIGISIPHRLVELTDQA
jgi:hypothetical protein